VKKFDHHLNYTKTVYTVTDVQRQLYPTFFNITTPDTGMLGCFCVYLTTVDPKNAANVQVQNPYRHHITTPCAAYLENYETVKTMSTLSVISVIIINTILKTVFRTLTDFEGHETHTEEIFSLAMKLFAAMLINTAFLVVLISGNISIFTADAQNAVSFDLERARLFSGTIADFDSTWYRLVGSGIASTMVINIAALNAPALVAWAQTKIIRCLDRGCTLDMTRTKQKMQISLEALYTGPQMMLEERYSALLVIFTVCIIYSGGMPVLWIVGFFSFLVAYSADKWAFLRLYCSPPKYGPSLARAATDMLPYMILVHTLLAAWSYSEPSLYDYPAPVVVQGDIHAQNYASSYFGKRQSPYSNEHVFIRDKGLPSYSLIKSLQRLLQHKNSTPHDVVIAVWGIWFVITKVELFFCLNRSADR
jgi:hypothetical protein